MKFYSYVDAKTDYYRTREVFVDIWDEKGMPVLMQAVSNWFSWCWSIRKS